MSRAFTCLGAYASLIWLILPLPTFAQDSPSFEGKTITMTVGFEAGNRVDLYGRLLGRTLTHHLPGQPSMVVMNRPGAGGIIALNDWNIKAEPNGLSFAAGGQTQLDQDALIRAHARYNPKDFKYVGGLVAPSQGLFVAKDALPRLYDKSAKPVAMGMVGATLRTGYYQVLWGAAFLGWNVKWVRGYPSTTAARTALERGEVDMSAFGSSTDINLLLATNKFVVASQSGAIINGKMTSRPAFGKAPIVSDLARGKITDPVAKTAFEYGEKVIQVGMWTALPPATSGKIQSTYVGAFEAAVNDPEFKTKWAKIDPDSPVAQRADLEALVNELSQVSPDALNFIQSELKRQGVDSSSR